MTWTSPLVVVAIVFGILVVATLVAGILIPQLPTLKQLLVGAKVPPWVVGNLRLIWTACGASLLTLATDYFTTWEGTKLATIGLVCTLLVHSGWTAIDQWMKRGQNDENPKPVAGGGPRDLADPKAGGIP